MNSKKIVITGSSGFLGSHLVERLRGNEQYEVYALTSKPEQLKDKMGGDNIAYFHKDDLNAEMLKDSIVINCAYPRNSVGTAIADGLKYIQKVFERSVESEATAIINISSQSVYSQQRTEAATEETPVCLESPYAVGKYAIELMLESICKGSGTAYTSLRLASLIGPGFDQRIVNRLIKQAVDTGRITVKRNQQKFGFFYIDDAVSGIVAVVNSNTEMWRTVYNIGRVGSYTLIDIAYTIKTVLAENKKINVNVAEIIDGDVFINSNMDCTLFYRSFDFYPQFSLVDSVKKISMLKL